MTLSKAAIDYRKKKGIPLDAPKMSHKEISKGGKKASPWSKRPAVY